MAIEDNSISVVLSIFWKESPAYLNTALESLYNQTHQADEIIAVCEGDFSEDLLKIMGFWEVKFTKNIFKVVKATSEKGLASCLNLGLQSATKRWIARFDTDDICLPERFEKQLNFLKKNPDIVLSSTFIQEYNEDFSQKSGIRKLPIAHQEILKEAKWKSPFNHPSAIYDRQIALKLGGYPLLDANEDYAFFCKFLVNNYITGNIDETLVKARAGDSLIARRRGLKYLKGEMECMKFLYRIKLINRSQLMVHFATKSVLRLMPFVLVKFVYKQMRLQ